MLDCQVLRPYPEIEGREILSILKDNTKDKDQIPPTEFAAKLVLAMEENGLNIDDIRDITKTAYESTRRIIRGITSPSNSIALLLSNRFKWDFDEIQQILIRDRMRVRHGELLDLSVNTDPALSQIVRGWTLLTESQRAVLVEQTSKFIKLNKAK